jgi:hypothetical protein
LVVRFLLTAGVDTTVHGLADCLYAFATDADEWRRRRERPTGAGRLRRDGPLAIRRTATTDVAIAGAVIPASTKLPCSSARPTAGTTSTTRHGHPPVCMRIGCIFCARSLRSKIRRQAHRIER